MSEVSVTAMCDALEYAGVSRPHSPQVGQSTVICAVSGGLDSMVLLHLLVQAGYVVRAVHVDHAAQAGSASWADWVRERVEAMGVTLTVHRLSPPSNNSNLEEHWRNARRDVFVRETHSGEILVTAHHKDDQAETLLLQLLRGAGPVGLQAMPMCQTLPSGAVHVRPLLAHTRTELLDYATKQQLEWIEDPSNQNEHFDRNYLRGSVLPLLHERWPGATEAIARSSELIGEAVVLNESLASQDACISDGGTSLDWASIEALGFARQANAVRFWLSRLGCRYPSRRRLAEALRQWNEAVDDRAPLLDLEAGQIQRYRARLVFVPGVGPIPADWSHSLVAGEWLMLPGKVGQLGLIETVREANPGQEVPCWVGQDSDTSVAHGPTDRSRTGMSPVGSRPTVMESVSRDLTDGGLVERDAGESGWAETGSTTQILGEKGPDKKALAVLKTLVGKPLTVRFRQNGERLRRASGHHQSLKHWFQDNDVPPIIRSRLPLIFSEDELVAIAGHWVDARYRPDAHPGQTQKVCYLVWRGYRVNIAK